MAFGAEVQSIKNRLDADIVKAGFFLCILVDGSNGNIQLGEAGAHGLDAQPVLLRGFRWNADGIVKTQFHSGDVVLGGAGAQRA